MISVVDILVVAFVIYEFLALIKGTRAALILVGVTVIALSVYFLRLEGLVTLTWVVNRVRPYALIALVVVFAPEIREALARLGRRLTMTRASGSESDAYDDIVLAANLFSQNQTGALMVIEREIGLRTYVESGVALEARIYPRLFLGCLCFPDLGFALRLRHSSPDLEPVSTAEKRTAHYS